ncbi:hypothetical protein HUJ04_006188 [Dendroctonus ponderosae]|nr:hypothetical protein HUJ04_006188 [Dendroctonus ponderosae]
MEPSCIFIVLVCPALLITQCQTHTIELNLQINFPNPFKKTHLDYSTPTNAQEFQGSSEDESNYPSHPQVDGRLKKVSTSEAEEQCKVVIDAEYTPKKLKNMAGLERAIVNHVGFLQVIYRESCQSGRGRKCGKELAIFGFTPACVQEYRPVKLLIQNSNIQDGGTSTDWFWIESSCTCKELKWNKWGNNERYFKPE